MNGYTLDASLGEFILTHPNVCWNSFLESYGIDRIATDYHSTSGQDLLI